MYFIGALEVLYLSILTAAEMLNHGKIVVCPTDSQSILFNNGTSDFKIDETDWGAFCTHIIITEYDEVTKHISISVYEFL